MTLTICIHSNHVTACGRTGMSFPTLMYQEDKVRQGTGYQRDRLLTAFYSLF